MLDPERLEQRRQQPYYMCLCFWSVELLFWQIPLTCFKKKQKEQELWWHVLILLHLVCVGLKYLSKLCWKYEVYLFVGISKILGPQWVFCPVLRRPHFTHQGLCCFTPQTGRGTRHPHKVSGLFNSLNLNNRFYSVVVYSVDTVHLIVTNIHVLYFILGSDHWLLRWICQGYLLKWVSVDCTEGKHM